MDQRHERGCTGEKFAADYFFAQGYVLRATRYRTNEGEIDLIVQRQNLLLFVEVKTRTSDCFGTGVESVNPLKLYRLLKTIHHYLDCHPWQGEWRLDVVAIDLNPNGTFRSLEHLEDVAE